MKLLHILLTAAAIAAAAAGQVAAQDTAAGLAEWDKVYAVFSHPRCVNCHVPDDRPRWSGAHYGVTRVHGFNVQRGEDGSGIGNAAQRCPTCHFSSNSNKLHGPPGAVGWLLAPIEMAWWEKSSAQICAQIKQASLDGGMSLDRVAEHMATPLVVWGWEPGPGREPAPGTAEEALQAIVKWMEADAPCPSG